MRKIFYIVVLLLMCSCSKTKLKPVFAGGYDSSFNYHEFSTPLHIPVTWDSLNLYGLGSDELDLNSDGEADVTINLSLLNSDSLHLINNYPDPYPSLTLECRPQVEMLILTEYTPTGQGSGFHFNFVRDLIYNERIDTSTAFSNCLSFCDIWREHPDPDGPSFGNLYYVNSISYIAFRFQKDKFGWIKIDLTDNKNPIFLSFAVQL